jgi:aspartyl-tRNA(Asn)/glutamyl-tRNA(Gln) amidotransferase subunit C
MAVTREEVLHIAELARLKLDDSRVDALSRELSAILGHIEVLTGVDTSKAAAENDSASTPLRSDSAPPDPLLHPIESFAPEVRHGFFIVPRLATHEEMSESGE